MKDDNRFFPMLAGFGPFDFTKEENIAMWEKFHSLPLIAQKIIGSEELSDLIYGLEKRFYLQEKQTEQIAILVRQYFLRDIAEMDFVYQIASICRINQDDAIKILRTIVSIKPKEGDADENEKPVKKNLFTTTLANAFSQFPAVKDQMITSRLIVTKPFLQPLQPSIKNWIMVYEKILGAGKHNALERGEFVFRAEATRGLEQQERTILATVLRSRDEDTSVVVDMDQRKIIFENNESTADMLVQREEKNSEKIGSASMDRFDTIQQASVINMQKKPEIYPERTSGEKYNMIPQDNVLELEVASMPIPQKPQMQNVHAEIRRVDQYSAVEPNDELQKEIMKNRMEIDRGLDPVVFSKNTIQKPEEVPVSHMTMGTENVRHELQPEVTNERDCIASARNPLPATQPQVGQSGQSAIYGKVDFSSNHNLPVEKVEKKELKSTHDYYMTPMSSVSMMNEKNDRSA